MVSVEEYQLAIEQHRSDSILESLSLIERKELMLTYANKCKVDNANILIEYNNRVTAKYFKLI